MNLIQSKMHGIALFLRNEHPTELHASSLVLLQKYSLMITSIKILKTYNLNHIKLFIKKQSLIK